MTYAKNVRVVSLAPSITEVLFAIGLDENDILGATTLCNYPGAASKIPKLGSLNTVSIEKLVSLKPDHVFLIGDRGSPIYKSIRSAGLDALAINPQSFEEMFEAINKIGGLVGKKEEARKLIASLRGRLKVLEAGMTRITRPKKVYVEIWPDPMISAGKNSIVNEAIKRAGGINITGTSAMLYPRINQEFVIRSDPDMIILGYRVPQDEDIVKKIAARPGWENMKALKNGAVITTINPDELLRSGPRIVDAVEKINRLLYGEEGPALDR